jgi:hypothetical protein
MGHPPCQRLSASKNFAVSLCLVIGIPTIGRASILAEMLHTLKRQTRLPDRTIVCDTNHMDVDEAAAAAGVEIVLSDPGLPKQRNAHMTAAPEADIMIFLMMASSPT